MSRYASVDARLAELAACQHGVVSKQQVHDAGLSSKALRVRVAHGRLIAEHASHVFRFVGYEPTETQAIMAAVLATGPTSYASHSSAATLFDLPVARQTRPEVTIILARCVRVDGVRVHRSGLLVERDVTTVSGVPATTPERIVADLSGRLTSAQLGRVVDDAVRRGLTTLGRINACAVRLRRAPGRSPKKLQAIVAERLNGGAMRESLLEDFVYDAIGRFGLPLPRCQHWAVIDGRRYRIDMVYEVARVAIEVDGFDPHRGRSRFHSDRARGNDIALEGYTLLRFTSADTDWRIARAIAKALSLLHTK